MKEDQKYIKLPIFLKPNFKTELLRIGDNNDGGYCIPKSALKETTMLYSFGLSDNWSFEKEFRKRSGAKIICFDRSVTLLFWLKRSIKDVVQVILRKLPVFTVFKRFFTFFNYNFFFRNSEVVHIKKFVGSTEQFKSELNHNSIINIDSILKKWESKNFFLKMDIEGGEYRVLEEIIKNQEKMTGLAIEFHDCDLMSEKIKMFINEFNLDLVHIHVNNYGLIKKNGFPTVIELTFSPKKYNLRRDSSENDFPIKNLDQPNNKNQTDDQVFFYK
jgi:hypothetical protein